MNVYEHFYSGSQNPNDVDVLVNVMHEYHLRPCVLVEIGVLTGQTARGLKFIADHNGTALEYIGIDPISPETHNKPRLPFMGARFFQMDSLEAVHVISPMQLDVVLVDGCHCLNHVILETILFGRLVKVGGWMIFHDTQEDIQGTMKDPHGPDVPEFYNSVLAAHRLINFPGRHWKQVYRSSTPGAKWGGMTAYQKI